MYKILSSSALAALFFIGCGGGSGTSGDNVVHSSSVNSSSSSKSSIDKNDVCSFISTQEASQLVGQPVKKGELDTEHSYPNAAVCSWDSTQYGTPQLILTYYLGADSHTLDYYAPPGTTSENVSGWSDEALAVYSDNTSANLIEAIVRSGKNALLLMAPYVQAPRGSQKYTEWFSLADKAAQRAGGILDLVPVSNDLNLTLTKGQ